MKQLPVSEYPEAWQLIVQASLQTKCGFKMPKGWERNELLAPSLTTLVVLPGESSSPVLPGAWTTPCRDEWHTAAEPQGFLQIAPPPAGGHNLKSNICVSETLGELWRERACGETALCTGRCAGKSCWKGQPGCQLMLTRLSILFLSNLVEILRHPKDKVWKLSCKLVPLKSKQIMNPQSNYHQEFSRLFSCYAKHFASLIIIIKFLSRLIYSGTIRFSWNLYVIQRKTAQELAVQREICSAVLHRAKIKKKEKEVCVLH